MPTNSNLVTKSADKIIHRESAEAKKLPNGFEKPEDGDWVCMSAEIPPEDEAGNDVVRVAGIGTSRHTDKSPIKLLGNHMRSSGDGPAIIGRMEEFKLANTQWKGKRVPAMFGRFSWAKDGEGKITELASKYKALWDGGYLDSVSIGFRPVKSRALNAEKPWDGYEYIESELIELSIVTIPANPAATVLRHIADTFEPVTKEVPETPDIKQIASQIKTILSRLDDIEDTVVTASKGAEQSSDRQSPQPSTDAVWDTLAQSLNELRTRLST